MSTDDHPKRRTVRVRLDPRFLQDMLALPEGYAITAAFASSDPVGIDLIVASDQLPEVEHHAESPRGYLKYDVVTLDEGGTFLRITDIGAPSPASPALQCCVGHGTMAHVRGCVNHPEADHG